MKLNINTKNMNTTDTTIKILYTYKYIIRQTQAHTYPHIHAYTRVRESLKYYGSTVVNPKNSRNGSREKIGR